MVSTTRQRLGLIPVHKGRGIVLIPGAGEHLRAVTRQLLDRYPRVNLFVCGDQAGSAEHGMLLGDLPPNTPTFARMLTRAKAHLIILGADCAAPRAWLEAAHQVQVPCVMIGDPSGAEAWLDLVDHAFVRSRAGLDVLREFSHLHAAASDDDDEALTRALLDAVEVELVKHRRQGKERRLIERLGRWLVLESPLAPYFDRHFEELPDLAALRAAIGDPDTIMALGNGPSSESQAVREASFDALFRVNHSWMDRGIHQRADVVFTGMRGTVMRHPLDAVFVLQTRNDAQDIRFKCATRRGLVRYATADHLGSVQQDEFGLYRPTNGAVMIATAVALQPKRLLVGGIDLFSHPQGSYPGDASTPNAYTLAHDRSTELAFILRSLSRYEGELTILNDILAVEWEAYRAAADAELAPSDTDSGTA